jgi:hypothetical protein
MRLSISNDFEVHGISRSHESAAVGEVFKSVQRLMTETGAHYFQPYSRFNENPLNKFHTLKSEWLDATRHLSSLQEIVLHPSYQRIIGMGKVALPMIFDELRKSPSHWFWALSAITMENPVKVEDRGNIHKMCHSWLQWAEDEGFT